jgi:hypothetical protein
MQDASEVLSCFSHLRPGEQTNTAAGGCAVDRASNTLGIGSKDP